MDRPDDFLYVCAIDTSHELAGWFGGYACIYICIRLYTSVYIVHQHAYLRSFQK